MSEQKEYDSDSPRVFLTDYASYNNGTQFEFGHWVDLTDFSNAEEFHDYVSKHFKECDEKSPLGFGSTREEMMITDFENFPRELYSESSMNFDDLFEYIDLDDHDKIKVAFILEQRNDYRYAIDHYENVSMIEDNGRKTHYELFEELYPEADKASEQCDYLEINYDRFIEENYTKFSHDGTDYLVYDGWD